MQQVVRTIEVYRRQSADRRRNIRRAMCDIALRNTRHRVALILPTFNRRRMNDAFIGFEPRNQTFLHGLASARDAGWQVVDRSRKATTPVAQLVRNQRPVDQL